MARLAKLPVPIQQAAEKAARALLTAAGVPFGTGHNLGFMAAACRKDIRFASASLASIAIPARRRSFAIPSPGGRLPPPPDATTVNSDIADLEAFLGEVRKFIAGTSSH